MVLMCCVKECKSEAYKGCGLSFHKFPKDEVIKNRWLDVVHGNITKYSAVCSLHFKAEDFASHSAALKKVLKVNAIPSIFHMVDESESGWTPSKSNLDNPSNSSKYIPAMKKTPIRNITEAKPKMIQSNIKGKADPSLPVQKPNLKLVLNRVSRKLSTAKMPKDIKKRRFIVDIRYFKKFL